MRQGESSEGKRPPRSQARRAHGTVSNHFGGKPLEIVSGYRAYKPTQYTVPLEPQRGKGPRFSGPRSKKRGATRLLPRRLPERGCGYYPNSTFVHVDTRDTKAYWVDLSTLESRRATSSPAATPTTARATYRSASDRSRPRDRSRRSAVGPRARPHFASAACATGVEASKRKPFGAGGADRVEDGFVVAGARGGRSAGPVEERVAWTPRSRERARVQPARARSARRERARARERPASDEDAPGRGDAEGRSRSGGA